MTANFSANITTGTAPLTVKFTDKSTGSPTGWAWYFGDENYTAPWAQVNASSGWSARWEQTSIAMQDGSIVLMGGVNNDGVKNDTWRSTNKGATWTLANASSGWLARYQHSSVPMQDGSIVLTGGQNSNTAWNDTWRSDDNGTTWTLVNASSGWTARWGHSTVAMGDGSIVLTGGNEFSVGFTNDTWRSTDNGTTWRRVNASSGWSTRYDHSSVAMPDGSIVLMGGQAHEGSHIINKNDVWRSTDSGATWTLVNASSEWSARLWHTSVTMPDGSIVLMGGSGFTNDTWRSMDNGATWSRVNASSGWTKRTEHSSVALPDGSIVLMGGFDDSASHRNDTWRFHPVGSSLQNPVHIYTTRGSNTVALQAYNAVGFNSTRKSGFITVTLSANTITVMNPNGGANWKQGSTQTIKWNYTGSPGSYVKIELLKGTTVNRVITSNTSIGSGGFGSMSWTVPYNQALGSDYKIQINSTSNSTYTDKSNANFTISAGAPITVVVPNGGANWKQGSTQTITWSYTGSPGSKVKTELLKGLAVNRVINASTSIGSAGSGSCSWTVPYNQVLGTDYKIRITSTSNAAYTDKSNANFTISTGAPITVVVPNGGANWKQGSTQTIKWSYTGSPGSKVKIELLKGLAVNRVINASTSIGSAGSGSYPWTIPSNQVVGIDYKIRINSTSNAAYTDKSNANFTISAS